MIPKLPTILQPVLANLAKGGIGAVLVVLVWAYTSHRQENRLDFRYQLERAEKRENRLLLTIDKLNEYTRNLEASNEFLAALHDYSPLAEWGKDVSGRYVFKNKKFDEKFVITNGLSPDSILFRTDLDIWPDSTLSAAYRAVDLEVMRTRKVHHQREMARIGNVLIPQHTWKFHIEHQNRLLGTAGIAIDEVDVCN